jgi:hypothetical protein
VRCLVAQLLFVKEQEISPLDFLSQNNTEKVLLGEQVTVTMMFARKCAESESRSLSRVCGDCVVLGVSTFLT